MNITDYQEVAFAVCAAPLIVLLTFTAAMGVFMALYRLIAVAMRPDETPSIMGRDY